MKKSLTIYNKINNKITKKLILGVLIVLTIILLIPIIWVAFYTHPAADDFNYGLYTINVFSTKGLIELLKGVWLTITKNYHEWQGTFSAIAIFSLNPSVWGNNFYFLTTFIILISLLISLAYLFKQIFANLLNKTTLWLLILGLYLLFIETLPDQTQGLYWWNGASYYMLFFSFELIEIALLIKRYYHKHKTKINYFLLFLLGFLISSGNYITALQHLIISFFLSLYLIIFKKEKDFLLPFLTSIISFTISALAPGNTIRANAVTGMNPFKAILFSLAFAIKKALEWLTPLNLLILGLLLLLLIPTYKKKKLTYKYPFYLFLAFYLLFAAEFTPSLYAQSSIGEGRAWNIMYISYLLFAFFFFYYLGGYLRLKIVESKIFTTNALTNSISLVKKYSLIIFLFLLGLISYLLITNNSPTTSYATYQILINKDAKTYHTAWQERQKILEDSKQKNVEFEPLSNYPYPIFYAEYDTDPNSWRNTPTATIYHKNYVVLKK